MKKALLASALLMFGGAAAAAPVVGSNVTTFESGATLTAAQLNTTISALVTAINDNAATIANLEAGNSSVSGRNYCMRTTGSGFFVNTTTEGAGALGASVSAQAIGLSFVEDGTLTGETFTDFNREGFSGISSVSDTSDPAGALPSATWTQAGNIVTVVFGGDNTAPFVVGVSKSGEVLMNTKGELDAVSSGNWLRIESVLGVEVASGTNCRQIFN